MKTIKWIGFVFCLPLTLLLILAMTYQVGYYSELNKIRKGLNSIEGVNVIEIWGHDDITLEEISAKLEVLGKGTITLTNLNKDDFKYPKNVGLLEFDGKSFEIFSCIRSSKGLESQLNIGTEGPLYNLINVKFNSPKEVLENYDLIKEVLDTLPSYPELQHFYSYYGRKENYIGIRRGSFKGVDPIYNLIGVKDKFDFAEELDWKDCGCNE